MPTLAESFVQVTGDFDPLIESAQDAGNEAGQEAGTAFNDRMKTVLLAGAAVVGAALVVGLRGAIEQSGQTGLLAAQLGATPQEAGRLGKLAGRLYAQGYGESLEEVNAALRGVVQNGIAGLDATDAAIEAAAAKVSNLAALLGEDAGRVSLAVSQMLRTGMAKSAEEAFDILARATQLGINKSEDLLDTINEYGTQFRKLGLDGTTSMGLLAQAIRAGARDSDVAADALKEFSIRAVDGSATARASFQALGFDADKMIAIFSKGGPEAAAALDAVLDALRATQGRADAATIAFGLFGTQSEDLGAALYNMDLSSAAKQMDGLAGAADRAGASLAGNAAAQVETFKRSIEQGLIDATARAIPYLQNMGEWIVRNEGWLKPLVATLGTFAAIVWAVNAAVAAHAAVVAAANAVHLVTIARTVALNIQVGLWIAAQYAAAAATAVATAATWALNAAIAVLTSPITLVIAAIVALIAIIVLAYKHNETFREIVQAAWRGIVDVALWAWNNVLKPLWAGLVFFVMDIIVPAVLWLWKEVMVPAWNGIALAIQIAWTVIQVIWGLLEIGVRILGAIVMWLWQNVFAPAWEGIKVAVQVNWQLIKVVWDAIVAAARFVADIIGWLKDRFVERWNQIKDALTLVWQQFIRPVFEAVGNFISNTVVPAFRAGVDAIGNAWDRLKELARKPVEFVVKQVVNPIVRGYNAIAKKFGGDTVDEIPGFAAGGEFNGQLPGRPSTVDNLLARGPGGKLLALATGEYVVNARSTAKHLQTLEAINSDRFDSGHIAGYADGGLLDWITSPIDMAKKTFGGPLDRLREIGNTPFGKMVAGLPRKLFDGLVNMVKKLFTFGDGGSPGGGFGQWPSSPAAQRGDSGVWRAILALVQRSGIPYSFGNSYRAGDPLWHGSGRAIDFMGFEQDRLALFFMSMLPNVLELIHRTSSGDYAVTRGRRTTMPTQLPLHRNHLHIAMAEGGMVADEGGWLMPGWNPPVYNGTGKPELMAPDGHTVELGQRTINAIVAGISGTAAVVRQVARAYG
jgi:hypothetical protein